MNRQSQICKTFHCTPSLITFFPHIPPAYCYHRNPKTKHPKMLLPPPPQSFRGDTSLSLPLRRLLSPPPRAIHVPRPRRAFAIPGETETEFIKISKHSAGCAQSVTIGRIGRTCFLYKGLLKLVRWDLVFLSFFVKCEKWMKEPPLISVWSGNINIPGRVCVCVWIIQVDKSEESLRLTVFPPGQMTFWSVKKSPGIVLFVNICFSRERPE